VALSLIILAIGGCYALMLPGRVYDDAKHGLRHVVDTCADVARTMGLHVDATQSQNDCLTVKPIAELAFAKIRVRSIMKYEKSDWGSTKMMVAHQAFDIRIGWSSQDNLAMRVTTDPDGKQVRIFVPPPHMLSISPVESTPVILAREEGWINKLTPEDGLELTRRLQQEAIHSADWAEGQKVARAEFEKFLKGLFQLQGVNAELLYTNSILRKPE
jgi:hypothetical protein